MAKNKQNKSASTIEVTRWVDEDSVANKITSIKEPGQPSKTKKLTELMQGRVSPQLCCTIAPEDKELLSDIALYACNREKKLLNTSMVVRALIRLGNKYKDELVF